MLANATSVPFTIENLEVVDAKGGESRIALFDREYIEGHSRLPGAVSPSALLGPGQSGFVKINLSFQTLDEVPESIGHVLTVSSEKPWGPYETDTIVERVALVRYPSGNGTRYRASTKG